MLHNLTSSFPHVASPVTPDLSHSCPMESSVSERMHKLAKKYSLLREIHQVFVVFANVLRQTLMLLFDFYLQTNTTLDLNTNALKSAPTGSEVIQNTLAILLSGADPAFCKGGGNPSHAPFCSFLRMRKHWAST